MGAAKTSQIFALPKQSNHIRCPKGRRTDWDAGYSKQYPKLNVRATDRIPAVSPSRPYTQSTLIDSIKWFCFYINLFLA